MNNLFFPRTLFPEIKGRWICRIQASRSHAGHAGHGACKYFMFNVFWKMKPFWLRFFRFWLKPPSMMTMLGTPNLEGPVFFSPSVLCVGKITEIGTRWAPKTSRIQLNASPWPYGWWFWWSYKVGRNPCYEDWDFQKHMQGHHFDLHMSFPSGSPNWIHHMDSPRQFLFQYFSPRKELN